MKIPNIVAHPAISTMFAEDKLSARFHLYRRQITKRGQSLYLCQILMHLKKFFPDYAQPLDAAITRIRFLGAADDRSNTKAVLKSMKGFATTVAEISEESHISRSEVKRLLEILVAEGVAYKEQHPASDDHRDELFFLVKIQPGSICSHAR